MNKEAILSIMDSCNRGETNNFKLDTALAWIKCLQENKSPIDRLRERGIEEIVIYGMTELGELLLGEAKRKDYKVLGIIDRTVRTGGYTYCNIPILRRSDIQKYKQMIIVVTAMTFWREIREELSREGIENVVSLRELL